jgi:hypothetical protein
MSRLETTIEGSSSGAPKTARDEARDGDALRPLEAALGDIEDIEDIDRIDRTLVGPSVQ